MLRCALVLPLLESLVAFLTTPGEPQLAAPLGHLLFQAGDLGTERKARNSNSRKSFRLIEKYTMLLVLSCCLALSVCPVPTQPTSAFGCFGYSDFAEGGLPNEEMTSLLNSNLARRRSFRLLQCDRLRLFSKKKRKAKSRIFPR